MLAAIDSCSDVVERQGLPPIPSSLDGLAARASSYTQLFWPFRSYQHGIANKQA